MHGGITAIAAERDQSMVSSVRIRVSAWVSVSVSGKDHSMVRDIEGNGSGLW